jgi:hypothetical protein
MKLATVMALAVVATPAFAQYGSYRPNPYDSYRAQPYYRGHQPYPDYYRQRSPNPAWDVYDSAGRYKGSDPDPFIRNRLRWERSPVDDP